MNDRKLLLRDQAAIVAKLREAGFDAVAANKPGVRAITSSKIDMRWDRGSWVFSTHPRVRFYARTWGDLDQAIDVASRELPAAAQNVVDDIRSAYDEVEVTMEGISYTVEAAIRHVAGLPEEERIGTCEVELAVELLAGVEEALNLALEYVRERSAERKKAGPAGSNPASVSAAAAEAAFE